MHVLPFDKFSKGSFKIAVLGDLMCEDAVLPSVVNGDPFRFIRRWLSSHDYVMGNLETTFSGETSSYPLFSSNDIFADFLKSYVNLVFTANNHCLDYGQKGVIRTISTLDKFGIDHIGTSKPGKLRRVFDIELVNHKLSILNYTQFTNEKEESGLQQGSDSSETKSKFVSFYNKAAYQEAVNLAKERSELVIVGIHQDAAEKTRESNREQREFLRGLVNNGADIVIGSHPHYFQGGEELGKGQIIVYSLGNFFSNMYSEDYPINCGCAMVMNCDGYENINYSFLPVATVKDEDSGHFFVIPMSPLEAGAYPFIKDKKRTALLDELALIRNTLRNCNLVEEEVAVHLL